MSLRAGAKAAVAVVEKLTSCNRGIFFRTAAIDPSGVLSVSMVRRWTCESTGRSASRSQCEARPLRMSLVHLRCEESSARRGRQTDAMAGRLRTVVVRWVGMGLLRTSIVVERSRWV